MNSPRKSEGVVISSTQDASRSPLTTNESGRASLLPVGALPSRILIAEDDEVIRELTGQALLRAGFVVKTTVDGEEAWAELLRCRYDLLITDNEMPRLKGIQLIERIRSAGLRIPIIVCSASFPYETISAEELQIAAVLPKPLGFHLFLDTVRRVLRESVNLRRPVAESL